MAIRREYSFRTSASYEAVVKACLKALDEMGYDGDHDPRSGQITAHMPFLRQLTRFTTRLDHTTATDFSVQLTTSFHHRFMNVEITGTLPALVDVGIVDTAMDRLKKKLGRYIPLEPATTVYPFDPATIELWSWLYTSEVRSEVLGPPALQISNEEFSTAVAERITDHGLPAETRLLTVHWDDIDVSQTRCVVSPTDSYLDFACFVTGIDRMGSFYYIEEKLAIQPPRYPADYRPASNPEDHLTFSKNLVKAWNKKITEHVRRALGDDDLSRFASAVSSSVQQVIRTLFLDRAAELRSRKEREKSQQELEQALERLRKEGFT